MRSCVLRSALLIGLIGGPLPAVEVTVKNDSLSDFSSGSIQAGFAANEQGAAWLDSPCAGTLVAVQVFWRSLFGGSAQSIENAILISESGSFPVPGALLQTIGGPLMSDGVLNEFRFLDDQNTIPLAVPLGNGQRFVVSFEFANSPSGSGPSLVTDTSGCQAGRNGIFADPPSAWFNSCSLGVTGDFVIRAVIDCPALPTSADLMVLKQADQASYTPGQPIGYTITVSNSGPAPANAVTVLDFFPAELGNVQWTCAGQGGALCPLASGNGNITQSVNLPVSGSLVYSASATVAPSAVNPISNTAQVVVPAGLSDPDSANNSATAVVTRGSDLVFENGFE